MHSFSFSPQNGFLYPAKRGKWMHWSAIILSIYGHRGPGGPLLVTHWQDFKICSPTFAITSLEPGGS